MMRLPAVKIKARKKMEKLECAVERMRGWLLKVCFFSSFFFFVGVRV